jgi:hypothetical protein
MFKNNTKYSLVLDDCVSRHSLKVLPESITSLQFENIALRGLLPASSVAFRELLPISSVAFL